MQILVIGGTGFIGSHVSRQLLAMGHRVCVFHRGRTEASLPNEIQQLRSDLGIHALVNLREKIFRFNPDSVINMIAMTEDDAKRTMHTFVGRTGRLVVVSSGDVYLAYARFTRLESGPIEPMPLREDSALRTKLYPYRSQAANREDILYDYDKILVERAVRGNADLAGTVIRLPKVYGPGRNADFATVHRYRHHPNWRWTHGYVENVAAAIALTAVHPRAIGGTFHVGEERTPTVAERLADISPSKLPIDETDHDFRQDMVYDTRKIREELSYCEIVPYSQGIRMTLESMPAV